MALRPGGAAEGEPEPPRALFSRVVWRLLRDYQPSYDPGSGYAGRPGVAGVVAGGERLPPVYWDSAHARGMGERMRERQRLAAAALRGLGEERSALRERLGLLFGALAEASAFDRDRILRLQATIGDRAERLRRVEREMTMQGELELACGLAAADAETVADALARFERAREAAENAAARALGWRPGEPARATERSFVMTNSGIEIASARTLGHVEASASEPPGAKPLPNGLRRPAEPGAEGPMPTPGLTTARPLLQVARRACRRQPRSFSQRTRPKLTWRTLTALLPGAQVTAWAAGPQLDDISAHMQFRLICHQLGIVIWGQTWHRKDRIGLPA